MPSKAAELRDLPDDELLARIDSAKEELFNLRFQLATGQLDNPTRIRTVRRDVARIATVLREREIEAELDATVAARELAATAAETELAATAADDEEEQ
jgi:large subunit ribosomal protein L29